jgi:hypothetical protein
MSEPGHSTLGVVITIQLLNTTESILTVFERIHRTILEQGDSPVAMHMNAATVRIESHITRQDFCVNRRGQERGHPAVETPCSLATVRNC